MTSHLDIPTFTNGGGLLLVLLLLAIIGLSAAWIRGVR